MIPRVQRLMNAYVFTLLGVFAAAPAFARPTTTIVIFPVEGTLSAQENTAVIKAVRKGITRARKHRLMPSPAVDFAAMSLAAGCGADQVACAASIGKTIGSSYVLRIAQEGSLTAATLKFTRVRSRDGKTKRYEASGLDLTTTDASLIVWHAEKAVGGKPKALVGSIVLKPVTPGQLDGAEVFLDDDKIARSALERVAIGSHRLVIFQKGFVQFERTVSVMPGKPEIIDVELEPVPEVAVTPPIGSGGGLVQTGEPTTATTTSGRTVSTPVVSGILLGTALVVGASWGVVALKGSTTRTEAKDTGCEEMDLPPCEDLRSRLDTYTTVNKILFYSAAGLAVAGVVTFLFFEDGPAWLSDGSTVAIVPTADGGVMAALDLSF